MTQQRQDSVGRNFALLLAGNLVSILGSSVYLIVVILYLKDATESAAMLGFYNFVALLPTVLLGPFAGAIIDRWSCRAALIVSDGARGVLMLLLAAIALVPGGIRIWHILLITAMSGMSHAFFQPAVLAIIPQIVPDAALKQANALRTGSTQIGNLVGNAVGGVVYALVGFVPVLVVNGLSFIVSAVQESWIRLPQGSAATRSASPVAPHRETPDTITTSDSERGRLRESLRTVLAESISGLRYILRRRGLRALLFSNAAVFLLSPPLVLVLPFVVEDVLALSPVYVGIYFAAMLAGGITAYTVWGLVPLAGRGDRRLLIGSFFVLALSMGLAGVVLNAWILAVSVTMAGACIATINLVIVTTVQRRVPGSRRARTFGLLESGAALSVPFAYLLAGVVVELLLRNVRLVFAASAIVVVVTGALVLRSKGLRRMMA